MPQTCQEVGSYVKICNESFHGSLVVVNKLNRDAYEISILQFPCENCLSSQSPKILDNRGPTKQKMRKLLFRMPWFVFVLEQKPLKSLLCPSLLNPTYSRTTIRESYETEGGTVSSICRLHILRYITGSPI